MSNEDSIKKPLKEWKENYQSAASRLSEISRSIAFAGIGIIWIFKNPESVGAMFHSQLFLALKLIVFSLGADFLQYFWKAINDYGLYRIKEWQYNHKRITADDIQDVQIWNYVPIVTWILFFAKIILVIWAYIKIYCFIDGKM